MKYGPATHAEEFCQKHVACPYDKCLGKTISVKLFPKSPLSPPYLKQDVMCRNSSTSLDRPLTSVSPFEAVVEMLCFFSLSETDFLVHKKQMEIGEILRLSHVRRDARVASSGFLFLFALTYL